MDKIDKHIISHAKFVNRVTDHAEVERNGRQARINARAKEQRTRHLLLRTYTVAAETGAQLVGQEGNMVRIHHLSSCTLGTKEAKQSVQSRADDPQESAHQLARRALPARLAGFVCTTRTSVAILITTN